MQVSASRELLFLGSSSFRQLPMLLSLRVCLSSKDTGYRGPATSLCPPGAEAAGGGGVLYLMFSFPLEAGPVVCGANGGLCSAPWWAVGAGGGAGSLSSRHAHHAQVVGSR